MIALLEKIEPSIIFCYISMILLFFSEDLICHAAPLKAGEENERTGFGKIIKPRQLHLEEKQSEFAGCEWRAALES